VSAILLATRSEGKLRELRPLFAAHQFSIIDLDEAGIQPSSEEDALEAFATFEENALAKARYFYALSGRPTVADDSGLCVDALSGAPGVLSKRWSGRPDLMGRDLDGENNRKLLEALAGATDRRAHYVCAAAYVDNARELLERGEVTGSIVEAPKGSGGFGYDPYFRSDELGVTFGEASREEKARVGHRARAFGRLLQRIR
jgi:XTP/dITP diphosphohydrolase